MCVAHRWLLGLHTQACGNNKLSLSSSFAWGIQNLYGHIIFIINKKEPGIASRHASVAQRENMWGFPEEERSGEEGKKEAESYPTRQGAAST